MKTYLVLAFIVLLGITLALSAVALWHMSDTTEFSRTDLPARQSR